MANINTTDYDESLGELVRRARLGRRAGSRRLGLSLYELAPKGPTWPYHYHHANEEMLIVLRGRPSLRTPDGWRELAEGEVVAFPVGAEGAHTVANRSDTAVRILMVSEMNAPEVAVYPDSDKVLAMSRAPGAPSDEDELAHWFRVSDAVDYWEGEERPSEDG